MKAVRVAASMAFTVYLTLVSAGAQGLVLCTGADGHVALEPAYSGTSCAPPAAAEDSAESGVSDLHCGPCVDTPLLFAGAHGWRSNHGGRLSLIAPAFLPAYSALPFAVADSCATRTSTPASAIPTAIPLSVLLI